MDREKSPDPDPKGGGASAPIFSPRWLRKFLRALMGIFAGLTLALWGYSLWGYVGVVRPAGQALETRDEAGLKDAVQRLETPHIFGGYEAWHGFGDPKGDRFAQAAAAVVGSGRDYDESEVRRLIQGIAYYIPAFIEHKVEGDVRLVDGDWTVTATLYMRWQNALRTGLIFSVYLCLVTLLLTGLYLAYRKLGLFARFE